MRESLKPDQPGNENPDTPATAPTPGLMAHVNAFIRGQPKNRIIAAAGGLIVLLLLAITAAILVLPEKAKPVPDTVESSEGVASPTAPPLAPLLVPTPPDLQSKLKIKSPETAMEDRFDALKRGDFSARTLPRHTAPSAAVADEDAAKSSTENAGVATSTESKNSAPSAAASNTQPPLPAAAAETDATKGNSGSSKTIGTASPTKETNPKKLPAPVKESPPPSPAASAMTEDGCMVGTSDAKGSAAAIVGCIRQFNAINDGGRAPKAAPKPGPGQ